MVTLHYLSFTLHPVQSITHEAYVTKIRDSIRSFRLVLCHKNESRGDAVMSLDQRVVVGVKSVLVICIVIISDAMVALISPAFSSVLLYPSFLFRSLLHRFLFYINFSFTSVSLHVSILRQFLVYINFSFTLISLLRHCSFYVNFSFNSISLLKKILF